MKPPEKPNIVFILADDLGYGDLGSYGCTDIKTPHLDKLARQGVRLTQHYAASASCSPTRASFMTGRYPQRLGLEWAVWYQTHDEGLPPEEPSLASLLRDAGYATALSGKWHLGYNEGYRPHDHGFDHFFGCLGGNVHYFKHFDKTGTHDLFDGNVPIKREGYMTDLTADYAVEFLDRMHGKPFFLYLPFTAPHFPFQGPDDADKRFTWHEGTRKGHYTPMVESMDAAIGRVLKKLDELGLTDNTIVVFTSDNGGERLARNAPFSGRKATLFEGGLRVPAIVRWPGKIQPGRTCQQVSHTFDWTSTFVQLAGADVPRDRPMDGIDLMPALAGGHAQNDRTLGFRLRGPYRKSFIPDQVAIRQGDWKYIRGVEGEKYIAGLGEGPYLFNLKDDPAEQYNLAASHPEILTDMKQAMQSWIDDVDPPLYDQYGAAVKRIEANGGKNPWPKNPAN